MLIARRIVQCSEPPVIILSPSVVHAVLGYVVLSLRRKKAKLVGAVSPVHLSLIPSPRTPYSSNAEALLLHSVTFMHAPRRSVQTIEIFSISADTDICRIKTYLHLQIICRYMCISADIIIYLQIQLLSADKPLYLQILT